MAREKWPFCDDWQERGHFDYHQTEHFLAALRQMVPSMTDDEERAVYRYMWNGNLDPIAVDNRMRDGIYSDAARFVDNPDLVVNALGRAYREHAERAAAASYERRLARSIGQIN